MTETYFKCPRMKFMTPPDAMLMHWAKFLDGLQELPKGRQILYISKTIQDNAIANQLKKSFSDVELTHLTKFEKKTDIFKIWLEEWK